jgi:hypothetical protein
MAKKNLETSEISEVQETYFQSRLKDLGLLKSPEFNKIPYFTETQSGNILIQYPTINGDKSITKTRFNPSLELPNNYAQPEKGNFLFFAPKILQAYADKTKTETLYITIGEFKAIAADENGLHCIGISNKNALVVKDELHPDLVKLIEELEIENIVLILDADIFNITWDHENEPEKDLGQNLHQLFFAIKDFRLLAKEKVKSVYLTLIRENLKYQNVKGLDDLFQYKAPEQFKVIEDLEKFTAARGYFHTINLSIENLSQIKSHLHINFLKGVPTDFYNKYRHVIENKEFVFARGKYKYDNFFEGLILVRHADSDIYMRIGCDYFRIIHVPNSKGILNRKLEGWKKTEIQEDYVKNLGIKNFLNTIQKHVTFCNVPENNIEKYQSVINGCYNLYYKLEHPEPENEIWTVTENFLKHIFGEQKLISGYTNYQLALDWLTIIYQNPTQKLPAICLVSHQKNTGKSTFLFWLRDIYKENATIVGNNDFNDTFNDDYIGKGVIGVDESFIDKKLVMETIKSMITDDTAKIRGLYSGRKEIPFIAKFVMTSNNESNFIQIDDDENRFWVNKVNPFTGDENPLLREEMIKEIPAFLNYLKTRTVLHPFKNRLYFEPKLLVTDALKKVRQSSQDWIEKEIRTIFKDKFYDHRYHTLYYSISEILEILNNKEAGTKFRRAAVQERLEETFKLSNDKDLRVSQPSKIESPLTGADKLQDTLEPKRGRLYTFKIEDFYSWEHIAQYFTYCTIEDIKDFRTTHGQNESVEGVGV